MSSLWRSFVPYHVAEELLRQNGAGPLGQARRFAAVALFADVSGFTPISEALGKTGRGGTEELTAILNSYFEPMIALIHAYGGIIGKFGGDAMTVLFPYTSRTRQATVRRAIQCAVEMQANMDRYRALPTSAGQFTLAMKAGLALGPVLCSTVGDPEIRLEYLIAGELLDLCADAEHHADKGEVVIHDDLLAHAGHIEVVEDRDGFSCIARLKRRARPAPLPDLGSLPPPVIDTLSTYLHPSLAQRLRANQSSFINEHRKVTVLFVSFSGFDYDHDPDVPAKLQHYLSAVIHIVHRYDGYLNKVDMGDKGSKYIILFGAPVIHENDEERALRCALELVALPDCQTRIGVNTGFVYCGQVGSPTRQEYTVMGDTVNLAARLMQAARPDQIMVSGATHDAAAEAFVWERFEPIKVKGKSEPIPVYAVIEGKMPPSLRFHEPQPDLPFVGRQRELEQAAAKIEMTRQGQGQILSITAEAGVGKSRLSGEIVKLAAQADFSGAGGACQSYGTTVSYLVWRDVWRNFFELNADWSQAEQISHLERRLTAIDPHLVQRLPLLDLLLNIPLPDNDLTRSLEGDLRQEMLHTLLLTCLRHWATDGPLFLLLEDCHWIDPLSQALLEFLGRNLYALPVLLLIIHRPVHRRQGPSAWAAHLPHFSQLHLTEFTPAEVAQFIQFKTKRLFISDKLPADLIERITQKAGGNPFYIEEMLNFIGDQTPDLEDSAAWQTLELPDSLHSLILSRIDRLAELEQATLKVASVIGRVFKAAWLWQSYPPLGEPEEIKRHLDTLSRLDLTPLDKPEPELEYIFKHITTQEVAYNSLSFALRETLHEHVGHFIERHYALHLEQYVDELAYHFGRSRNRAKQKIYYRWAGDAAKIAYANEAAVEYYQHLLPLLVPEEQGDIMLNLGEVWQLTGHWAEAEQMYRQAFELAQTMNDDSRMARCQLLLGHLLSHNQAYQEAIKWLEQARQKFSHLEDHAGLIRAFSHLSFVCVQQGRYDQALSYSEQQLDLATQTGDRAGVSAAAENIGLVHWGLGDYSHALESLLRALDVAKAAHYHRGTILAGNDVAGVYWEIGDYRNSVAHLQEALTTALDIDDSRGAGMIIGNAGEIYRLQGDYDNALRCYQQGLQIMIDLGDWAIILNIMANIARVYTVQGRFAEAEHLLNTVIPIRRILDNPYALGEDLISLADLYEKQKRYHEARQTNQETKAVADQVQYKDIQFQARLLEIRLSLKLKLLTHPQAVARLERLLEAWPDDNYQAAIYDEIWQSTPAQIGVGQTAAELYKELYQTAPTVEYRQRYHALTGDQLSPALPLPPVPQVIQGQDIPLDELLLSVETLLNSNFAA